MRASLLPLVALLACSSGKPAPAPAENAHPFALGALPFQTSHAPLVERAHEGVEVSWRFEEKPAERVVRIAIDGATVRSVSADGVRIVRENKLILIGHGTFVDADGVRTAVPAKVIDGAVAYELPENGRYPAVLDPTVSTEIEVEGPVDDVAAGNTDFVATRFDGTNYVVAWTVTLGNSFQRTRWERVSATGALLDGPGLTIGKGLLGDLRASATESVVFINDGGTIGATRISKDGKKLDATPIVVGTPSSTVSGSQAWVSGWDGTRYVVLWDDGTKVHLTQIGSDGAVTNVATPGISSPANLATMACATTGTCMVLRTDSGSAQLVRIGATGAIGAPIPLSGPYNIWLGGNGSDFVTGELTTDYALKRYSTAGVVTATGTVALPSGMFIDAVEGSSAGYFVAAASYTDLGAIRLPASGATPTWSGAFVPLAKPILNLRTSVALSGSIALEAFFGAYGNAPKLRGMRFDTATKPATPPATFDLTKGAPGQYQAAVASDGTSFLVTWLEERASKYAIRARRFDATGKPLDPASTVLTGTATSEVLRGGSGLDDLVTFFDGTRHHVIYREGLNDLDRPFMHVRVAADGTPIDATPTKIADGGYAASAAIGAGCGGRSLVAWDDGGTTLFRRFDDKGDPVDPTPVPIVGAEGHSAAGIQFRVGVSCASGKFLVTWAAAVGPSSDVIGTLIGDGPPTKTMLPVATLPGAQHDPYSASDGTNHLVAFRDVLPGRAPEIHAVRVDATGKVLDSSPTVVLTNVAEDAAPVVTFDGSSFVVTAQKAGAETTVREIAIARVRTDGVLAPEDPTSITKEAILDPQKRVGIASDGKGNTFVTVTSVVDEPYQATRVHLRAYTAKHPAGATCAAASDCDDGQCVDGVCCKTACTGPCEACDVPGSLGVCTTIGGKPHGARSCGGTKGDACGEGACDGKDATKCASFTLEVGGACGAPACAGTSYVAAPTCSATRTCESKPKVECAPYRCAPSGCLKTCASDEGCVDGARCVAGSCVEPVTGARCSDDKLASIAKDGTVTSCAPYRCDTDGACAKSCAASSDCVPGYACDTASGTCAPPEVADSGSGGCTTAPAHGRGRGALAALGLMLLALFARRKHALALVLPVLVGCRSGDAPKSASSTASTLKVGAVSTTTDPNDSAISVSPEVVHTGIACHATGCLLVEPRGPWIVGVRIGLDGKAIDPHGFVIAADTSTDVAVGTDGKDFLVVWARFFRPSAVQRVSGDGKVVGAPIDLVASSTFANFSQVGFDGKTWVVAWREGRSGTATIDVARFATDGTALDPLGATVYDSGLPALADVWPSLACDGSGCTIGTNTKKVIRVVDAKIVGTPVDVDFKIDSASKNGADLVFHGLGTDGERVQAFTSAGVAKGASKLIAPTAIPGVGAIGRVGSDLVVIYRGIADNEIDLARLDATTLAVLETKVASGPLREVRSSQSITAGLVLGSDQSFFRVTTGPLAIARFSPSTRGAAHLYPTSASDGTSHFVAFARQADGKHAVLVSKVDGATFAPASGTTIANETSPVRSVSMAWDGTSYVVSWITDTRVAFARVDAAGTVLDPGGVKVTDVTTAASWCGVRIVPTSTGSLATLLHDDVLGTVRFDKTGKALDAAPQTKTLASIKCESIAAVPAGANVLFAWAGNYDYDSYGYIDSVRIGADGKVIDATPKRISNVHGESFITQLGVVSDGTHLLFGYSIARKGSLGTDVELLRVAADLSDAPVLPWLVSARDPDQESVSLALTGDRAMMAWTENVGSAQELRVSLLDPTAKTVLVDAAKVSSVSAGEIQRTVIASFAGSSSLLVDQRSNPDPAFMTERLDVRTVSFDALGGATCAKNDDCELGPCVDGVCCNRACDGACESCNEVGSVGTCVTVAGAPRGSRSCGGAAGCAEATCDGFEPKSCLKFAHAFETKCAEPKCDGALFTSSGYCDGKGSCSVSMTASCAPFKCDPSGCLTSCSSDASCAMGFLCKDGKCVAPEAKATCVDDGLSSQAADGTKKDCAPFRCGTEGTCLKACSSSVDCAPGKSCDTATGACLEPTSADSGGCAFSSTRQPMSFFAMLLAMGLLFRRRR